MLGHIVSPVGQLSKALETESTASGGGISRDPYDMQAVRVAADAVTQAVHEATIHARDGPDTASVPAGLGYRVPPPPPPPPADAAMPRPGSQTQAYGAGAQLQGQVRS